jgi:hypothetical protein
MSAQQVIPLTNERRERCRDISGFALFSTGAGGPAHVMAHRMLDRQRYQLGHQLLGAWLKRRTGIGSDWVHLQWHMAVFELALNQWDTAFTRFRREILPTAAASEEVLTDAPALLWRLSLAARTPVKLPWQPLRMTALARMQRPSSPYVELHNLLALAGAGDLVSLDQWLQRQVPVARSRGCALVARMAVALRAYAAEDFELAASVLASAVPYIAEVGGSRAQNQLFAQLAQAAHHRARANVSLASYRKVA